jgi:hypothetical protein
MAQKTGMILLLLALGTGDALAQQPHEWVSYEDWLNTTHKVHRVTSNEISEATFPSREAAYDVSYRVLAFREETHPRTGETRVRALYMNEMRGEEGRKHTPRVLKGPFALRLRFDDAHISQPVRCEPFELYLGADRSASVDKSAAFRSRLGNALRELALQGRARQRGDALPQLELLAGRKRIPILPGIAEGFLKNVYLDPPVPSDSAESAASGAELARRHEPLDPGTLRAYWQDTKDEHAANTLRDAARRDGAILQAHTYHQGGTGFSSSRAGPDYETLAVAPEMHQLEGGRELGDLVLFVEDQSVMDWGHGAKSRLGPFHLTPAELGKLLTLPLDDARRLPVARALMKLAEQTDTPNRISLHEKKGDGLEVLDRNIHKLKLILGIPRVDRPAGKAELERRSPRQAPQRLGAVVNGARAGVLGVLNRATGR